jgi:N-acetyl-gamma-glutamyl-phosphate reductase
MIKIRAGVYGASGYAGLDLIEIFSQHPTVETIFATSNTYAGDAVPFSDLKFAPVESVSLDNVDVIFLALPHKASAGVAKMGIDAGVKVVDLSADLRINSPDVYEKYYQTEHPHPELLPVVYGLPEINREQIKGIDVVATPGCYPTATLLGLYPLLQCDAVEAGTPIVVDAKCGVTGAGRKPALTTHFAEVYSNVSPYKTGRSHRHIGEIEQEAHKLNDKIGPIIFSPHLLPVARGLMSSIYVTLNDTMTSDKVHDLYSTIYQDEPLVDVLPLGQYATLKQVVKTNKGAISITPVLDNYVHITSVIDNLRKGTSGQATQNLNLMFGLPETTGLL